MSRMYVTSYTCPDDTRECFCKFKKRSPKMKQDRERRAGDTQTGEETKLVREKAGEGGAP